MAIVYTKHAAEMLIFRKIKKEFVEKCIQNFDDIKPVREGKNAYLKDFGKNYLKVIVSEEGENIVVITLYWIAKGRVKK
jgi:hypothetical protein